MRRRVLTGVQTGATVVTQISHVVQVCFVIELKPARHCRKYGAKAFTVTTGVADLELASHFGFV
jgi:hypothetical protein